MVRSKKRFVIAGLMVVVLLVVVVVTARYPGITGKVVDAETGKPIPGAVVLVQWWLGHGIGFEYHTVYKTVETQTDEEGKFTLPGAYYPLVDPPAMIIYCKGYVPWRNDADFETKKHYEKAIWKDHDTYRLRVPNPDYSRDFFYGFISYGFQTSYSSTPLFSKIVGETHRDASAEAEKIKNKMRSGGGK